MNDLELSTIRARCDAATPGPWCWEEALGEAAYLTTPGRGWAGRILDDGSCSGDGDRDATIDPGSPDGRFVAAARTDVSRLLAEVARLQEYERRWRNLQRLAHHYWQFDHATCWQAAMSLQEELLRAAGDGLYCRERGHDCATWQPPAETETRR